MDSANVEITEDLIVDVIQQISSDLQLIGFEVKAGSSSGDNFTSTVKAIDVDVRQNGASRKIHLIAKLYPSSPLQQQINENCNLFGKEIVFYRDIVKDINEKQAALGYLPIQLAFPTYIHGLDCSPKSFMVMENLKIKGYRMVDRENALSLDHAKLVMMEYAKIHAAAQLLKLDGPIPERYRYGLKEIYTVDMERSFLNILDLGLSRCIRVIKAHSSQAKEVHRLSVFYDRVLECFLKIIHDACEPYATICQGDSWCNNLLFRYENDECDNAVPVELKILDWQMTRYASPCMDLSFMIYSSIDAEVRRPNLKNLLGLYHQTFVDTLTHFGQDTSVFTWEAFWSDWEQHRLYGFLSSLMLCVMLRGPVESVVDHTSVDAETMKDPQKMKEHFSKEDQNISKKCIDIMVSLFEEGIQDNII